MPFILFALFVAVPLIELALLIKAGQVLGFWATIGIVVATALAGSYLLHAQGFGVMRRVQAAMFEGRAPVAEVADGFFLLIAGAFLLTPGLITDCLGLALMVPPFRRWLAAVAFKRAMKSTSIRFETFGTDGRAGGRRQGPGEGTVIEGDYTRVEEKDRPRRGEDDRGGGRRG